MSDLYHSRLDGRARSLLPGTTRRMFVSQNVLKEEEYISLSTYTASSCGRQHRKWKKRYQGWLSHPSNARNICPRWQIDGQINKWHQVMRWLQYSKQQQHPEISASFPSKPVKLLTLLQSVVGRQTCIRAHANVSLLPSLFPPSQACLGCLFKWRKMEGQKGRERKNPPGQTHRQTDRHHGAWLVPSEASSPSSFLLLFKSWCVCASSGKEEGGELHRVARGETAPTEAADHVLHIVEKRSWALRERERRNEQAIGQGRKSSSQGWSSEAKGNVWTSGLARPPSFQTQHTRAAFCIRLAWGPQCVQNTIPQAVTKICIESIMFRLHVIAPRWCNMIDMHVRCVGTKKSCSPFLENVGYLTETTNLFRLHSSVTTQNNFSIFFYLRPRLGKDV